MLIMGKTRFEVHKNFYGCNFLKYKASKQPPSFYFPAVSQVMLRTEKASDPRRPLNMEMHSFFLPQEEAKVGRRLYRELKRMSRHLDKPLQHRTKSDSLFCLLHIQIIH
jgi:hypothetical protein